MSETLLRSPATDAAGPLGLGLQLYEQPLEIRVTHNLASAPALGQIQRDGEITRLRHWPEQVWHVAASGSHLSDGTDISHGQIVLRLRGHGALRFLADYTTADLRAATIRQAGTVRTRLGHYTVLLWWDITRDIHIAVDRSQAQSLVDHLRALIKRREPHEHLD
nr:hypothetical protein [uncultured Roseovarius sp.]